MKKIFKNMIPYWKVIVLIVLLLVVQAFCDLALPQYTSDIIDVGIINNGVSHTVPEKITQEDYEKAKFFMTDEEKNIWDDSYTLNTEGIYERKEMKDEDLDALDETLRMPLLMVYQAQTMADGDVKTEMQEGMPTDLTALREQLEKMTESVGSSTLSSMGAAYAASCDKAAGMEMD